MAETLLIMVLYLLSLAAFCLLSNRLPILSKEALHRVSSLDGLRGILATSTMVTHFVVSYHWHVTGIWEATDSRLLNNMGAVPVSLFFMITGYLFIGKICRGSPDWSAILASRVRRILPMYLFTVALIFAISFYQTQSLPILVKQVFSSLGYWVVFIGKPVNGFTDSVRINASVQWTLLYEATFYLCLPVIYCMLRRRRPGIGTVVAVLALACLWPEYHHYLRAKYFKLFLVGALVALFESRLKAIAINYAGSACTAIAVTVLFGSLYLKSYSSVQMVILGIPFALFVLGNNLHGLLENRGLKILGEISFSIYLLHGIVIYTCFSLLNMYNFSMASFTNYALYLPVIVLTVSTLSILTYWCIERPFLRKRAPQHGCNAVP